MRHSGSRLNFTRWLRAHAGGKWTRKGLGEKHASCVRIEDTSCARRRRSENDRVKLAVLLEPHELSTADKHVSARTFFHVSRVYNANYAGASELVQRSTFTDIPASPQAQQQSTIPRVVTTNHSGICLSTP